MAQGIGKGMEDPGSSMGRDKRDGQAMRMNGNLQLAERVEKWVPLST